MIFLLRRGGSGADRLIREVVRDRSVSAGQWREILEMLQEYRSLDMAYERALEYAGRAKACLTVFPPGRERDALLALTDYVLLRYR